MLCGEDGKASLQEAAVERGVVGDNEDDPAQKIVDGLIVDDTTRDRFVGDAGDVRDLARDREAGIFEPLPGAKDFVDLPGLSVILEEANAELDNLVAVWVGAGGLNIHDGGDEL